MRSPVLEYSEQAYDLVVRGKALVIRRVGLVRSDVDMNSGWVEAIGDTIMLIETTAPSYVSLSGINK